VGAGALARLAAYYFAYFAQAGAYVPYFSLYLEARGLAPEQIALVVAMPQAARLFAPTLWGWLGDALQTRYRGARRAIVVFSACAALCGFGALQAIDGVAGFALVMLAVGALSAGALPIVEAITLSALAGRSGDYGPVRLWGSVGFILAVLGGGAWLDRHGATSVLGLIVALSAALCVAALAIPAPAHAAAPAEGKPLRALLGRGDVRALLAAGICMAAAHGALYGFFSILLAAEGYSKSLIGALWTLGVVAEIALFMRLPQLMRRFSLRALLLASFALAVVRFLGIGCGAKFFLVLAAAQLLHAATFGVFHAASIAAVHRLFASRAEARGQALYASLAYGVGGTAGTLLAGWTWTALGPALSFGASALFAALGGILIAWKVRV